MTSLGDNTTVVGEPSHSNHPRKEYSEATAVPYKGGTVGRNKEIGNDFISTQEIEDRPFFVPIGKHGVVDALQRLDAQLVKSGQSNILSKKSPVAWTGHEVSPGNIGLINHGGVPKILTKPGRYPRFPFGWWWARTFKGIKGLSDTVIDFQGLTVVQVSQNQAAVISDPQNRIFVIKNSGFAAYSVEGSYTVLGIVDQTHLPDRIQDGVTKVVLGWSQEVKMQSSIGGSKMKDYVAALFLNIPANNCAILQRGDDLELIGAGQHCVTNPEITLRGLYTLGENQLELPTKDIYTRDQVPVSLTIYLKWQLQEPLKLTQHGYDSVYTALHDKTQSILTQIVSHLDYSSIIKQRSLGPDNLDDGQDPSSAFLDALRTRAMDDLTLAAQEYGIELRDLAVIDRQFKGEIAHTMDKLTTRALQAQVEAANVDRENSNKIKQEEGALSVARIAAQARNTKADAEAYAIIATAKAHAEKIKIEAEAESNAILTRARAYKQIEDSASPLARDIQLRQMDIQRVQAYGNKTVFVPNEVFAGQMASSMAAGMAAGLGSKQ
ncbi:hypothetical protein DL96DRAFT_1810250 [Flagelloscypha sp. PMI_526]|nr:hypothetical protein DL96DRAFT_1810250 [Flagelloscypha sp. PMI_526]